MQRMKELLDEYPQLRSKLYIRGFLLSPGTEDVQSYPFWGTWKTIAFGDMRLLVHPLQHAFSEKRQGIQIALIGHAMNPFSMEYEEKEILNSCLDALEKSEDAFWRYFNQLTGIFTCFVSKGKQIWIIDDASGMQTTFYTVQNGKLYVSSHTMLLGELLGLEKDPYVEKLVRYRFFPLFGNSLPGDLTQFIGLKRMTPNFCGVFEDGKVTNKRFFAPHQLTGRTNTELAGDAGEIIHKTLTLISEKWEKPAISMTGGCDSKTTLSCANGIYDRFRYYSYNSDRSEQIDCDAAGKICKALGLDHIVYVIPDSLSEYDHTDVVKEVIRWNCGDIAYIKANEVRKRIVMDSVNEFDVEVKSWASEIGRAYYSKRFHGRTRFPARPKGRYCTTLYKFFFHDRRLVRKTDRVFDRFIKDFYLPAEKDPIPWFEQFFWEHRIPSWNGLVISGEHSYSSADITIPYNNRILLTILLSASIEDRINDTVYSEIRQCFDSRIDATNIKVTNLKHTDKRGRLENAYWVLHSKCPL